MKSYFQKCELCGCEVMLSELQHSTVSHVVCRDVLACDRRLKQNQRAELTTLQTRLKAVEAERSELIKAIGKYREQHGIPDPVELRHQVEITRIEADLEC
jgi:hypothetical protein